MTEKNIFAVDWNQYATNWNEFVATYPIIEINGMLEAGIENSSSLRYVFPTVNTGSSLGENTVSLQFAANYFETAGRYTSITVKFWRDSSTVYFNWYGYFKGGVTNKVRVDIQSLFFKNYM